MREGSAEFIDAETFDRNPSKRYLAVELEIAKIDPRKAREVESMADDWELAIVEDGSLPNTGFEINSRPAQGDEFCKQAEEIGAALKAARAEVSAACGYHVHIDARDFSHWDLRKLVKLYARVEDALFSLVSPSRQDNHYCEKCGPDMAEKLANKSPRDRLAVYRSVYGRNGKIRKGEIEGKKHDKYNSVRYAALNLHSWFYRGTVECRLHHGTADPKKVICWALLWAGILDYCKKTTELKIAALQGESFDILLQLAPTDEVREWLVERRGKFNG